jgi:hypothetical protein
LSFSAILHRFDSFKTLASMNSFILTSMVILYCVSSYIHSSNTYLYQCACCTLPSSPCTLDNQTPLNMTACSLCISDFCKSTSLSQCPSTNSQIRSQCRNISTSGSYGTVTTHSTGISIIGSSSTKYLFVGVVV